MSAKASQPSHRSQNFETLIEALSTGFELWAEGVCDEFTITLENLNPNDKPHQLTFFYTTCEPMTPTSPNWENSELAYLCGRNWLGEAI